MATTMIMKKTPIVSSCRLLSDITMPAYVIVAPHSGQNLELAGIEWPHFGQLIVAADGGVREASTFRTELRCSGNMRTTFGTYH